ncbi:MAG: sigma-70 family RNA polymerase sigma factor [Elusimicrobiota bacterium]|nr:sigma-70 family RNA polymerase sigma factor [Elusimicrobiota bacterium]
MILLRRKRNYWQKQVLNRSRLTCDIMNFEELYEKNFNKIFAYVKIRIYDKTATEDVCSAIWLRALDKIKYYDAAKGAPEQWLFTIARNEIVNHIRYKKLKSFVLLDFLEDIFYDSAPLPQEQMQNRENISLLQNALKFLSEREKDLISLKFYSAMNNRQIAAVSGLSESNVGTILNRAAQKLKTVLEGKI